jgi:trigger factor
MQLTETRSEGLQRVFKVVVPAAELEARLAAKIEEVRPRLRINGFRPGKVPSSHVRKIYGPSMLREIIDGEVDAATKKALDDGKLRVATQPDLQVESDMEKVFAGQADLAFNLNVELIPEFEPVDPATVSVERLVAPVADTQVDEALTQIAKANRTFEAKEGAAADGDALTIDFLGKIDGVAFEGGAAEKATVTIGSGQFIPGFEEALAGLKAGDEKVISVTFPETYAVETLKGKPATFDIKVHEVRAPQETALDDEFAKKLGLDTLDAVKDAIRGRIQSEHTAQSRQRAKRALFDKLEAAHDFPLPPAMVEQEFSQIWRQIEADKASGAIDESDAGKSDDELRAEYRKIAERRVKLGLVLAEIGRRSNVEVTNEEVSQAVMQQARQYPGQERQVFEIYQKNPQLLAQLRAPIFEEKTVDYILELAKVTDKTVDRDTLFADPEE